MQSKKTVRRPRRSGQSSYRGSNQRSYRGSNRRSYHGKYVKIKKKTAGMIIIGGFLVVLMFVFILGNLRRHSSVQEPEMEASLEDKAAGIKPDMKVDLLTPNEYSRSQIPLKKIKGIVVHYTANPNSTAQNNRDYFEGLRNSHATKASSHFVIGMDGEIVQCIPTSEIAYASNQRNKDTISIECCHKKKNGQFEKATMLSLIRLCTYLCVRFDIKEKNIIRHYDVTGKQCPKYYVQHPDAWNEFIETIHVTLKSYQEP